MAPPSDLPIIVIGGGWAGLACAVELVRAGRQVRLIEAAPQLGGRARAVDFDGLRVDNGQHLVIGAYRELLAMLADIGINESSVFRRLPLHLQLRSPNRSTVDLRAPPLPAPAHLGVALALARGIRPRDRLQALRLCLRLVRSRFTVAADISVLELLQQGNQSPALIHALWEPLCLATLNTHVTAASAQVFLSVLEDAFMHARRDADLLIPRLDLGRVLPGPAQAFIEDRGTAVHLGERVTALRCESGRMAAVETTRGRYAARDVVLATGPEAAARLLAPIDATDALATRLAGFTANPICTVYLRYPAGTTTGAAMIGLLDMTTQWVFDRRTCGQPGIIAAVISGDGPHMALGTVELADLVARELANTFPAWPAPERHWVIREKRATFRATVGINAQRPGNKTILPGLWLAGDYTAVRYPATLEGAVRSGRRCAAAIIAAHS